MRVGIDAIVAFENRPHSLFLIFWMIIKPDKTSSPFFNKYPSFTPYYSFIKYIIISDNIFGRSLQALEYFYCDLGVRKEYYNMYNELTGKSSLGHYIVVSDHRACMWRRMLLVRLNN